MTREKAINLVMKVFDTLEGECNIEYDWREEHEARDMAIKALEQDNILDKIRAEIVDLGQRTMNDNRASGIWACVDIIDKYKEREGKK